MWVRVREAGHLEGAWFPRALHVSAGAWGRCFFSKLLSFLLGQVFYKRGWGCGPPGGGPAERDSSMDCGEREADTWTWTQERRKLKKIPRVCKELACNAGDPGSIPGSGRSPGEGHGNPLQYSCLETPMDRGAWRAAVHGVTKNTAERLALSLFLSWSAAAGGARTHLPAGSKCDPAFAAKR